LLIIIIVPAKYVCIYHQQKLFDNQKYMLLVQHQLFSFIAIIPSTASIIDIVPSAVNQEKQLVN
jgi:hypothetical protein